MAIRCGLIIEQRPVGIAFPRPETASGGLRHIPRHRVGRTCLQPTDAPWKNRPRYDLARRGAVLPQKQEPKCPGGSRLTLGGGGSGTLFAFLGVSAGGSGGVSIPWSSLPLVGDGSFRGTQFSGSVSITPLAGVGAFAGLGPGYSAGNASGASPTGFSGSSSTVLQLGAGDGGGVEVSGVLGGDYNYGASAGAKGAIGAYGAIGRQFSGNYNSAPLGCRP